MSVYTLNPLEDPRWEALLSRHPRASIFHTTGWLQALHSTYGYKPVVLTTAPPGSPLTNGLVFCRVDSWLTGRRLVSLPFSDHCDPLVATSEEFAALVAGAERLRKRSSLKSIEIRPLDSDFLEASAASLREKEHYYFHHLDLRPTLDEIYRRFHKDCVQRKIRRAEREGLTYEEGRSEPLLQRFYQLLTLTRRRHQVPPQPVEWFRHVVECLGENAKLRVCYKDDRPVAAMITLTYKNVAVYKYGCSDAQFHNLGGVPYLFWIAIRQAKQIGAVKLDLGRTDLDTESLALFKEHLGGTRSSLTYWTCPEIRAAQLGATWKLRLSKKVFSWLPNRLVRTTGTVLYKHIG